MKDKDKTKKQFINELAGLRQRVAELEAADTERKWAEEELRQSERELRVRNQINTIFLTYPDEEMYAEVLKVIQEVMESEFGTFGYFDEDGSFVAPAVSREIYWEKCNVPEKDIIFQKGTFSGIWGRAIKERKTLLSNDGSFNTPKGHISINNTMVTPIIFHGKVISAIHVANKPNGYDEEDRGMLETIADQIAPVLYARLQRDKQDKERRLAEEALRESEGRLREIVGNMPVLFDAFDENGIALFWNKECERVTGYGTDEIVGNPKSMELLVPDPKYRASILEQLQTLGHNYRDWELEVRCKNGETRTIAWSNISRYQPIPGWWSWGVGVDITERKRAEEELQRLYEQAQRDAETKATLLNEVNHRVKNNLLAIVGFLYAERRYAETTDQAAYRAITQSLMNRVNGLSTVHGLLSASEWAPLLLSDLAGQVVRSSLQMLPRHKGVSVEVTPSPLRVTPDQAHSLALVINELATNTVKHALQERDTGRIIVRIALEDEDDTVRFEFRDDGPGYLEDVLQLERYSVGFDLIQNMVRKDLRGELSLHNDDGAVAEIRFKAQA